MTDKNQLVDPIIEELHAVRRKLHDDCGGDVDRLAREMRGRQNTSGHPIAAIPVSTNRSATQEIGRSTTDVAK